MSVKNKNLNLAFKVHYLVVLFIYLIMTTGNSEISLPDPDGKPANMSKPVKVFILLGQSNMLGAGEISPNSKDGTLMHAVQKKKRYSHLVDKNGNWTIRNDVRYVQYVADTNKKNDWLTVYGNDKIGPELQIGHILGENLNEPVLLLKCCIGNRSLGWDLLPPGSKKYEFDGNIYAGYKDSPLSWPVGTKPVPKKWYGGIQYDQDIGNAKKVLKNLSNYYPGAKGYEIAGFFWWQGDKDRYSDAHASKYEENLVRLIKQLRQDFNAPKAKFVCATLGQSQIGDSGNEGAILDATLNVDSKKDKYSEFKGNVASVYTNPLSKGGSSNGHYNGNAETYMDVGEGMGLAMKALLNGSYDGSAPPEEPEPPTEDPEPPTGSELEVLLAKLGDNDGDGIPNGYEEIHNTNMNKASSKPKINFYVSATGSDFGTGTINNPLRTIQNAINQAKEYDIIGVQAGTYQGVGQHTLNFKGKNVLLLALGKVEINLENAHRAFVINKKESSDCMIKGLRFSNGKGSRGGVAYIEASSPSFISCIFLNSQSDKSGGAMALVKSNSTFLKCQFKNNLVKKGSGGAVHSQLGASVFVKCKFTNNKATNGGALSFNKVTTPSMVDGGSFKKNTASKKGGAIYIRGDVLVTNAVIKSNTAGKSGGGIESNQTYSNQNYFELRQNKISGNNPNDIEAEYK